MSRSRSGARDFSASAILDDKHDKVLVSNRIDNPIVALANPIEVVRAFEFCGASGVGTVAEGEKPFNQKLP